MAVNDPENDDGIASLTIEDEIGIDHHDPHVFPEGGPGRSTARMVEETIERCLKPLFVRGCRSRSRVSGS